MNQVVGSSVVVAALLDSGDAARWAQRRLLAAASDVPELLPIGTANILRWWGRPL
ncbi:hypothetical protein [Propionicimonas sp.]|uniref:hypothetical protein n=1 Tax=Propionicimonas sp. TaxID=1955623 RepID=UPI0039E4BA8F